MTKKSILIVEDEQDILELYRTFLADSGFEVDTASDGEEGLKKIAETKAQVVLLDIMMPKIDGIGVLQLLKEKKAKLPKIIMLTNLSHDKALEEAKSLGAKDCIIKSEVTPDQVLQKINHLLET